MMKTDGRPNLYASVLLLCGLPGSGKSTLAKALKLANATCAEDNEYSSLLSSFDDVSIIDYDQIACNQSSESDCESEICLRNGCNVDGANIEAGCEEFDSEDLEAWRKSRVIALRVLKDALYAHFTLDRDLSCKSMLIIMDDNFHLRSMRREVYRLCQDVVTALSVRVGFSTIHVSAPLEVCLQRNIERKGKRRVPDHVIRRMASVIEPPDSSKPYGKFERFHVTTEVNYFDDDSGNATSQDSQSFISIGLSLRRQIEELLREAQKFPVSPRNELSPIEKNKLNDEKAREREMTRNCHVQRMDQLLRKLVGEVGKVDKSRSKLANEARKQLLERLRSSKFTGFNEESIVSEFKSIVLRNDSQSEMSSTVISAIQQALNLFLTDKLKESIR